LSSTISTDMRFRVRSTARASRTVVVLVVIGAQIWRQSGAN
jgi:hypothetical protein